MKKMKQGVFTSEGLPWYDGTRLCACVMGFMALVNFFGWSGLFTFLSKPEWKSYWHLPVILIVMSASVFMSTALRLVSRHLIKKTDD
jgi:hypothetical protein